MPNSMFDLVTAVDLAAYWKTMYQDRAPYLGEELFPADKKLGLKLEWLKGSKGLPVVLKPSAYDVAAVPRPRMTFEKVSVGMPFFKESMYVDEELRQQLNMVLESGNQAYIDAIINNIFADNITLIEAAAAQRERMRMSLLSTGGIAIAANGQSYTYDYGLPANHKVTAATAWSDPAAKIVDDIRAWADTIEDDTGVRPTRAICSRKALSAMSKNDPILKSVFVISGGIGMLNEATVRKFIMEELEIELVSYNKRYVNESGQTVRYMPEDVFSMLPTGPLGKTWFGTTPEESDLLRGGPANVANVALVDTGVAVTTIKKADPVNVDTKVTMISLPSFEAADQVMIADVGV